MELLRQIGTDILVVYYSLGLKDAYNVLLPLLYLPLFFFPLKGVDRRDPITGATHAVVMCLGALLLFVDLTRAPADLTVAARQWFCLGLVGVAALWRFHAPLLKAKPERFGSVDTPVTTARTEETHEPS